MAIIDTTEHDLARLNHLRVPFTATPDSDIWSSALPKVRDSQIALTAT
jgi:hypothetical protein